MPSKRKPATNHVETEAKIPLASFAATKRRMKAAGARLVTTRTLETNTLFDLPDGSLRSAGKSFRVRRYGALGSVTLKGAARVAGGIKSRVEIETEVASPEMLGQILMSLGFVPTFRYDKFREVWNLGEVVICLDETPIGFFIEVEGAAPAIHRGADQLGLDPRDFVSASYPALWIEAGRSGDMVFGPKARAVGSRKARR